MRNKEVERGCTNNNFEKFCYIGSGGWRKDVRLREGLLFLFFDGKYFEIERNQVGLGYDIKEERRWKLNGTSLIDIDTVLHDSLIVQLQLCCAVGILDNEMI